MIWCMIAALLLLAVFAISALIAEKCLQMVVNPVRYDVDYVKALETTNGFSDCIEQNGSGRPSSSTVRARTSPAST